MLRWKIARIMGIDLYVHWTFLLAPVFVVIATWERGAPILAQNQAILKIGICEQQDHRGDLLVAVMAHELRDFGVGHRVRRFRHLARKGQGGSFGNGKLAVVFSQAADDRFIQAGAAEVGNRIGLAISAVIGVRGAPAHHAAQLRI